MTARKWMLALPAMALIAWPVHADETTSQGSVVSAKTMAAMCNDTAGGGAGACNIFFQGFLGGYFVTEEYYRGQLAQNRRPFCPHVSLDAQLAMKVFEDYLAAHPEKGDEEPVHAIKDALADHWPCKE